MTLAAEVDQVGKLGVIDVRKDSQELLVDVLGRCEECRREFAR